MSEGNLVDAYGSNVDALASGASVVVGLARLEVVPGTGRKILTTCVWWIWRMGDVCVL